jgi:hypothetical protein
MKKIWDEWIRALVLIRFGQEIGQSGRLAETIAGILDMVLRLGS